MAVREFLSASSGEIVLGGDGAALTDWGMMVVCRPLVLTSFRSWIAAGAGAADLGAIYYDATSEITWGSASADLATQAFTVTTTDWLLVGARKAAGTTAPRFSIKNLTTGAAATHADATASGADVAGNWNVTRFGDFNAGGGQADIRIATAGVFDTPWSDAQFAALTGTAGMAALSPDRLWDFNQASTATPVKNVLTGLDDQSSIVATSVITTDDPPNWTMGLSAAGGTVPPHFHAIPFM